MIRTLPFHRDMPITKKEFDDGTTEPDLRTRIRKFLKEHPSSAFEVEEVWSGINPGHAGPVGFVEGLGRGFEYFAVRIELALLESNEEAVSKVIDTPTGQKAYFRWNA